MAGSELAHDALILAGGEFVKGLSGGKEAGAWVRAYVSDNVSRVVARAAAMLRGAGAASGPVPPRRLLPLLEAAGMEDNPELQERWAALLANEAIGTETASRDFSALLRELTVIDARALDLIAGPDPQLKQLSIHAADKGITLKSRAAIMGRMMEPPTTLASWNVDAAFNNLERLGLIVVTTEILSDRDRKSLLADARDFISVTTLGLQLVLMCRPPHTDASHGSAADGL